MAALIPSKAFYMVKYLAFSRLPPPLRPLKPTTAILLRVFTPTQMRIYTPKTNALQPRRFYLPSRQVHLNPRCYIYAQDRYTYTGVHYAYIYSREAFGKFDFRVFIV